MVDWHILSNTWPLLSITGNIWSLLTILLLLPGMWESILLHFRHGGSLHVCFFNVVIFCNACIKAGFSIQVMNSQRCRLWNYHVYKQVIRDRKTLMPVQSFQIYKLSRVRIISSHINTEMIREEVNKALIPIQSCLSLTSKLSGLWTMWQQCLYGCEGRAMVPIQSCQIYKLSSVGYALWQPHQPHQYYGGEARKRIMWELCW